ncbi:MAG: hypothetical protein IJU84_08095 [Clostridia bacterium]|nr:hypothetical protein [Clostridia bacterium]
MLTTDALSVKPDLLEVVNLFDEAEELEIIHSAREEGFTFYNRVTVDGRVYEYKNELPFSTPLENKRYFKRLPNFPFTGRCPVASAFPCLGARLRV